MAARLLNAILVGLLVVGGRLIDVDMQYFSQDITADSAF